MAFDNGPFVTLAPFGETVAGVTFFSSPDLGAQYIGAHLIFEDGFVVIDQQFTLRRDNGQFDYFAHFKNLENRPISFVLTGGGFV